MGLGVGALLREVLDVVANVDGRACRTLRELTTRPGPMVRDYLDGKRARYVHPFRYAFVTCGVWWLMVQWALVGVDLSTASPLTRTMLRHGNWANLALLPVLALPVWLAFVGARIGYLGHTVSLLFAVGHLFLWRAVLVGLGMLVPSGVWNVVDQVVFAGYLVVALVGCHRRRVRFVVARAVLGVAGLFVVSQLVVPRLAAWLTG